MSKEESKQVLTTHPYLRRRWDKVGRKLAFVAEDKAAWEIWHEQTVTTLRQLIGYDTMQKVDPTPQVTEEVDFPEHRRQRLVIQTEPNVYMPVYVLIPKAVKPPYSVVVAPHGHSSGGKLAVAGCRENPAIAETIAKHNYDYGVQFVKAGFLTFCPDARGFGERQEEAAKKNILNSSCQFINNMALPLGQTVTGMWAWDIHRLIDHIQTREDCLPDRIGCAGLSGGGLQTLWATALDDRIKCAIISGYLYGYKESLLDMHTNCSCNYIPHLYEHVDMGDIGALIAPRPLVVETGTKDSLNGASGLENVYSQIRIMQKAYRLLGAEMMLKHDVFEGEHRWNGVMAIPWMKLFLA